MQSANAVCTWEQIQERIQKETTAQQFATWFGRLEPKDIQNDRIVLEAPTEFHRDWIHEHYSGVLESAVQGVCGEHATVEIRVPEEGASRPVPARPLASPPSTSLDEGPASSRHDDGGARPNVSPASDFQPPQSVSLGSHTTFDRFVVGPHNKLAVAAGQSLATDETCDFTTLIIQSAVGLGKSHLLQAMMRTATETEVAGRRVAYLRAETFVNDFVQAIAGSATQKFRQRYRELDFVCFDDLHLLAGKRQTQQELMHTFVAWRDRGARVVFAATCEPGDGLSLDPQFQSILSSAFRVSLRLPDEATRRALVKAKARSLKLDLGDDVLDFLADLPVSNVRELEGAVTSAVASTRLSGATLSLHSIRQALQHDALMQRPISSPDRIVRAVCEHFEVTHLDLCSRRRPQALSFARQVAMYLLRERTELSLSEIGAQLGGRDHTTVLHGIRKIEELARHDRRLQDHLSRIRANLDR